MNAPSVLSLSLPTHPLVPYALLFCFLARLVWLLSRESREAFSFRAPLVWILRRLWTWPFHLFTHILLL
jgi:hypothetical protein